MVKETLIKTLHVAAAAVSVIMSSVVWIAKPELMAEETFVFCAPNDSAASAHTVVTRAAAEATMSPVMGSTSSADSMLLFLQLEATLAIAAAKRVTERAA